MPKAPSEATQIRTLKADLKSMNARAIQAERQREAFRIRAMNAEQEVREWKTRFDLLLSKAVAIEPKGAKQ